MVGVHYPHCPLGGVVADEVCSVQPSFLSLDSFQFFHTNILPQLCFIKQLYNSLSLFNEKKNFHKSVGELKRKMAPLFSLGF